MQDRAAQLTPEELEPIMDDIRKGRKINAIRVARETLRWSLHDCMDLVETISQEDSRP